MSRPLPRARSVFLNVPYDLAYRPTFDALVWALVCCGLVPRAALEHGVQARLQLDNVRSTLLDSALSIHDLSLVGTGPGDAGPGGTARLNMAFEFGLAMGLDLAAQGRGAARQRHACFLIHHTERPPDAAFSDGRGLVRIVYDAREDLLGKVIDAMPAPDRLPVARRIDRCGGALARFDALLAERRAPGELRPADWLHVLDDAAALARECGAVQVA